MEPESKNGTPAVIPGGDVEVKDDSAGAGGASSGPGMNGGARKASVTAQNVRNKAEAIEESLKMQKAKADKNVSKQSAAKGPSDPFKTPQRKQNKKRGQKRRPDEEADDSTGCH